MRTGKCSNCGNPVARHDYCDNCGHDDPLHEAMQQEIERLRKDAERWRWWRDKHGWSGYFDDGATNSESAEDIDAAIDKAMSSQ